MDVFQEIVRPLSEICTGFSAAPHHGVDDGCVLGCIVISTEKIVLSADGFYSIVKDLSAAEPKQVFCHIAVVVLSKPS